MALNENVQWLYDNLKGKGIELGTPEQFNDALNSDKETQDWAYKTATNHGLQLGTPEQFLSGMGIAASQPQDNREPEGTTPLNPSVVAHPAPTTEEEYQRELERQDLYQGVAHPMDEEAKAKLRMQQQAHEMAQRAGQMSQQLGQPAQPAVQQPTGPIAESLRRMQEERQPEIRKRTIANNMLSETAQTLGELQRADREEWMKQGENMDAAQRGFLAQAYRMNPYLEAANSILFQSEVRMQDAQRQNGASLRNVGEGLLSFAKDTGRHLLTKLEGMASFGFSDLRNAKYQRDVLKKVADADAFDNPEAVLTPQEKVLYDATITNIAVEIAREHDTSRWSKAGQITADMIPFVEDIMLGNALFKGFGDAGRKAITKGVERQVKNRLAKWILTNVGDVAMSAGESAATAAILPHTYANMYNNNVQADMGKVGMDGDFRLKLGGVQEQSLGQSWAQAYKDEVKELFTETGGNFRLVGRALVDNPIGKRILKTPFGEVLKRFEGAQGGVGSRFASMTMYHGVVGEWLEELEGAIYDGNLKDFFTADTQLPMLLSFSVPAAFTGGLNAAQHAALDVKYKQAGKTIDKLINDSSYDGPDKNTLKGQILATLYQANTEDIPSAIGACVEQVYPEEYKTLMEGAPEKGNKAAELAYALKEYLAAGTVLTTFDPDMLGGQIAAVQEHRQQMRQQAEENAQAEISNIAHQDGNIYRVGVVGRDDVAGYAMSGDLNIETQEDGSLRARGTDLVTVKFEDGHVEQLPANEVSILEDPENSQERLQAVTEHLFARYANNDIFAIGDKVHVKKDGKVSDDSSTITAIDDDGVHVEMLDELGQVEDVTIPHEQAAEILAIDESGTEEDIVTYSLEDGSQLRLRQVNEGVFETIAPDETGRIYTFTSEDLAEMGATQTTATGEPVSQPTKPSYPTDEAGNPDWTQIDQAQASQILYELFGNNKQSAQSYAEDMLNEANKVQKSIAKKTSHNLNIAQRIQEEAALAQEKEAANAAIAYWNNVKLALGQIKTDEERAAEEAQRQSLLQARERRSKTEVGHSSGASMAERYNAAQKIEGTVGTTTLPDGRELSGRYMLISPEGLTPSHNATENFKKTEGYPVTSNGQSINDRDYTNDKEEQQKVQTIAQRFNGNAIKNMPIISDEGLVYNGNGRIMAGQLAAVNNTDAAYTESLTKNAAQFGFTPEQVASIPHARIVFQLDERLPYSTQSLAIFNEQETQTQNNTGKAAGYARKLTPQAISEILAAVDGFNTIDAFFNDTKAPHTLINNLINAGIIAQREKAEMVDGEKLSATGKERLSNILFGTVFDDETIRLMGDDAALKSSILRALPQILENKSLGDYSLEGDINDAIRLLYEVRKAKMPFLSFVSQTEISEDGQVHTAAENYTPFQLLLAEEMSANGIDAFRNVLTKYNEQARTVLGGQKDIFGNLMSFTELKNLILSSYGKQATEPEEQPRGREANNPSGSAPASNEPAEVTTPGQAQADEDYEEFKQLIGDGNLANRTDDQLRRIIELGEEFTDPYDLMDMTETGSFDFASTAVEEQVAAVVNAMNVAKEILAERENVQEDPDVNYYSAQLLKGKDISAVRKILGHWWVLHDQSVNASGKTGYYIFDRAGYGRLELHTDPSTNIVRSALFNSHNGPAWNATPDGQLENAEAETDTNPTEAQKKAENYKQGHVTLWGLPITIENPKGSTRRGTDANGKKWEQLMHHTYGKIRQTEGVDGDHIDVFIGPNLRSEKVFVVDQRNVNNGEFDEHKCMLGFDSLADAQNGYLSNYEPGWQGMGVVTEVTMDEFKKWIDSSHRKTKPFADYKSVKPEGAASVGYEDEVTRLNLTKPKSVSHLMEDIETLIKHQDSLSNAIALAKGRLEQYPELAKQLYAENGLNSPEDINKWIEARYEVVRKHWLGLPGNNANAGENSNNVTKNDEKEPKSEKSSQKIWSIEKFLVTLQTNKEGTPEEQAEQQRQIDFLLSKGIDNIIADYIGKYGNKLDPDELRKVFTEIGYNGTNVPQFKYVEGQLRAMVYSAMLQKAVAEGKNTVVFISGCAGCGKSRTVDNNSEVKALTENAGVLYDAPLADYKSIDKVTRVAFEHDIPLENITVVQVYNDVQTNFQNVLERAHHTGRTLSLEYFIASFTNGKGKLQEIQDYLPEVKIISLDNSGNNGGKIIEDIEQAKEQFNYDISDEQLDGVLNTLEDYVKETEENPDSGRLSADQLAAIGDGLPEVGRSRESRLVAERTERLAARIQRLKEPKGRGGGGGGGQTVSPSTSKRVRLKKEPKPSSDFGAKNTIVTQDEAQSLLDELKGLLDDTQNLNIVADPARDAERSARIMTVGTRLAMYYIEGGARKFADFCEKLIEHIGDAIRPYLRSIYMAAKYNPEMAAYAPEMDNAQVVEEFDVDNFRVQKEETPEEPTIKPAAEHKYKVGDRVIYGAAEYEVTNVTEDGLYDIDNENNRTGIALHHTGVSEDLLYNPSDIDGMRQSFKEQFEKTLRDMRKKFKNAPKETILNAAKSALSERDRMIDQLAAKFRSGEAQEVTTADTANLAKLMGEADALHDFIEGRAPKARKQEPASEPAKPAGMKWEDSPLGKQYAEIKGQYPDATLLFRTGNFYELYADDAKDASEILGITLTHRKAGDESIPMAGFPFLALDEYLPKLVRAGKRVAICDSKEGNAIAGRLVNQEPIKSAEEQAQAQAQEPAPEQEQEVNNTPVDVVSDTIGEIKESKHTKTGAPIYVVKPLERVDDDEFKTLKARAKANNGYYSRFVKGFVFNSINDATRFNNINDEQTTTEQTSAGTEAALQAAETAVAEASAIERDRRDEGDNAEVEPGTPVEQPTEEDITLRQEAIAKLDDAIEQINEQLAVLGYYEADTEDAGKFNESYGYIRTSELKALKDAERLAKQLAADLGLDINKRKKLASANIAPAGGDVSFKLPLLDGKELCVWINLEPNYSGYYRADGSNDDLAVDHIMWRIEDPTKSGTSRYLIPNQNYGLYEKGQVHVTYAQLYNDIRVWCRDYLPKAAVEQAKTEELPADANIADVVAKANERRDEKRKKAGKNRIDDGQQVLDLFADVAETINDGVAQEDVVPALEEQTEPIEQTEDLHHGYKVGDKVIFRGEEVDIVDFERDGRPVLNSFGTRYITEIANWEDVKPIKNDNNGSTELRNEGPGEAGSAETGSAGQPADENGTLGGGERQTAQGPQSRGVDSGSQHDRQHDGERSGGAANDNLSQPVEEPVAENERKNTRNFRYDPNDPAPTQNKARYDANIAAIRLLKQLQDEGRQATPVEQRTLAKFTGWGGLGEYFKGEPGTTYYGHGEKSPYEVIKELLTDEELQAAQLSRNSAYYTPADIIDQLWSIAKKLGFRGGNILEGSAGIGNILSQIPKSINDRSNIQAVEIDDITAGILEQLYPDATTHHAGFQEVDIPNNSQDLVITNVPFVRDLRVRDSKEKDLTRRFGNSIQDFCIAKNVRKLRQGGIGIFITSHSTLDSSKDLRRWLYNEGETDVLGAFRLNRETFGGTGVTSDIIVVRKRVNNQKDAHAIDVLDTAVAREALQEQESVWDRKTGGYKAVPPEHHKLVYNKYFVEHPEMIGGEMGFGFEHGDTRWGGTTAGCYTSPSIDQAKRLQDFMESIVARRATTAPVARAIPALSGNNEKYTGNLPYGAIALNSKDEICNVRNGELVPIQGLNDQKVKGYTKAQVVKDYNALKEAIDELLKVQSETSDDESYKPAMRALNRIYDSFAKKYGRLNSNVSLSFIRRNDVQWASIAAIEKVKETVDASGKKKVDVSKTDLFYTRVVGVQAEPHPENTRDGIILSVQRFGDIRPAEIAQWLDKSTDEVEREIIESRLGFRDPESGNIVVSHEYLSGNVREKLEYAQSHNENGEYDTNIEELQKVIPIDVPAHLIEFNVGSTWIPIEIYQEYLKEKFGVTNLTFGHVGSSWVVNTSGYNSSLYNETNRQEGVYSQLCSRQIYGHELMISAMNNVPFVVQKTERKWDGSTETITDKQASAACNDKIGQIKDDFVEWARGKMQGDQELADRIQKIYNDRFNAIVPMTRIDPAFLSLHLPGQNHKYDLYPHQQQAIVRGTMQPIMLAHEVGTGKTISLISIAMEMRRLGTAKKPMIVVQNATTKQFVADAKDLYPNAKILTVDEQDRTPEGRREFYAKIKYNDWDLIIIPHSVFEKIPDNESRVYDFIKEKIDEKIYAIEAAKEAKLGDRVISSMEKELENLRVDLANGDMKGSGKKKKEKDEKREALRRESAKARAEEMVDRETDETEDFDSMGIDALLVDEAHEFKHLGFATMMARGIKGIDPSYAKKSAALYLKLQSIYERKGHRNVVFATGTPISNTAAEIWTFMKYLLPKDVLKDNDIYYFDDFVHNFGRITEMLEFATNGKFKANLRFAQYGNVPELMRMWLSCADCVLTREAGQVNDKVPELEGNKAQDIFLPQSPSLIDIMAAVRAELDRYDNMSGAEKKENSHIPLTMYGIAKRAAVDPRLVDGNAADEPLSKTNKAVEEVLRSLKETKKYNGTVAIFCDNYQNKVSGFNLFDDIKAKLVKAGVPATKVAIIRQGMSATAKQKIFDAVREGEIRVIMGSTYTLGTGVNIQTRLHTLIHMDAPDRPMDYTQRNGRIIRQGNMHKQWNIPVRVLRFGVEDSLDVTSYQRLKTKAGFIDSIMNGKSLIDNNLENRIIEDVEEGLFDNPVAVLSGSQYALLKSQAERDLRKWTARLQQHNIEQMQFAARLKSNASSMKWQEHRIEENKALLPRLEELFPDGAVKEYNVNGTIAHTPEELREAVKELNKYVQERSDYLRRSGAEGAVETINVPVLFNGVQFDVDIQLNRDSKWKDGNRIISVKKSVFYSSQSLGISRYGSETTAIDKLIENIVTRYLSGKEARDQIKYAESAIARMEKENELMAERVGKPFEHTEELEKAQALVDEYTAKMQEEMAEKEAKYAGMASDKKVELVEQEDDETPESAEAEAQIYDMPEYTPGNLTPAQELATAAVFEALADNTDLDVEITTDIPEELSDAEFSIVDDKEQIAKLEGEKKVKAYRAMVMVDGKLYPPMSSKDNETKQLRQPVELGKWEQAEERPDLAIMKDGKYYFRLRKDDGTTVDAAYNPYFHASRSPLNDQFTAAFNRPNLVTVEVEVPESELTSGYQADKAKDAVGEVDWHSGPVSGKLSKLGNARKVILSRWNKPIRIVPDREVADKIADMLKGTDIAIPYNVVTPSLRVELEQKGVVISDTPSGNVRQEEMRTPSGKLYGWAIGNKIYITPYGINPNTPIHEYSHLWAKAMQRNNAEGWQSVVDLFKDTPLWNEVLIDENYSGLKTDDAICSEVLARYSGSRGATRMEEAAAEWTYEAQESGSQEKMSRVTQLIHRVRRALAQFWDWVGTNLFSLKRFESTEQVADRVLYDLLAGTELGDLTGEERELMISDYTPAKARLISEWNIQHPRPQYRIGETLKSYEMRLSQWEEERNKFRAQLKEGIVTSANTAVMDVRADVAEQKPMFVPGVRPTPQPDETPGQYALRLQEYYKLMRDEQLAAEYVAEINRQADAAARVLKGNTLVRGLLDAAKPIENFQEWLVGRGGKITAESNAYQDTFLATGRVSQANEKMNRDIIRPLAQHIGSIIAPDKETGKSRLEGLHIVWHNMDVPGTGSALDGKELTPREIIGVYAQAKDCAEAIEKGLPDRGQKGFVNNLDMTHDQVIKAVESVISKEEIDKLWTLIRKATKYALEYDHESGRISDDTFEEFSNREYYVPQRGWRERDESGIVSEYEPVGKRGNDPYNAALVRARGRQTLASDPFAYIMSIDASSIISSENNKIKQNFLRFCLDNEDLGLKTGAFRVKKYWIMNVIDEKTGKVMLDENGAPMMTVSYSAPSSEDLEHDKTVKGLITEKRKQIIKVQRAFDMQNEHGELGPQLEEAYKSKIAALEKAIDDLEQSMHVAWHATNSNIAQRTSDEKKQHEVQVLLDGQKYVIELQDEKLANAINKKFKQHQEELFNTSGRMRNATRFISAMLTQYNPEFAASNFARDFQVALATLTAEHRELVAPFLKNFATCQAAVWVYAFNDKVRDREQFINSQMGQYLREYFESGAPTGFSYMQDLKSLRQDFDSMISESNVRRGLKGAVGVFSMLTEVSETAVRFAGFVSAREAGMHISDAAYLSKELTTNFDRAGEIADSNWMSWFSFFRATLNGNIKFLKALKKMPLAYSLIAASYVAMGMLNQFLNPDDPDDEIWASDYTRQSNFIIGKFRVPTAHFLRMFFAAGVNLAQWIQGRKEFGHAAYNTATFASNELLPNYLNLVGNGTEWNDKEGRVDFTWEGLLQGVMPSPVAPVADVYFNRDFRGATINREPFAKSEERTKDILRAKEQTLPIYKWFTQSIYEAVGGNMETKYKGSDPAWRSWLFDTSASSVEHVVDGYLPAGVDMLATLSEAIYDAATGEQTGPDKWPFVRKFYNAYTPERAYSQQYYLLKGRVKEFDKNLRDYQKNDPTRYRMIRNSQEYRVFDAARKLVRNEKENPTNEDVKALIEANKAWIRK